jgi:DNA-binding NarL/FixJ family response regulator
MQYQRLSKQKKEVLRLIALGFSKDEIAERLVVSEATIGSYLHDIYNFLNVSNLGKKVKSRALASAIYWKNNIEELQNLKIEGLNEINN